MIVVPGARDEILEASGVRCYRLRGPSVPDPEAVSVHAGHPVDQPHRGARAARPDRGRQRLVRAVAGAPRHPAARRARRLVLPQQLSPRHRALRPAAAGRCGGRPATSPGATCAGSARLVRATLAPSRARRRASSRRPASSNVLRVPLGVDLELFHPARRATPPTPARGTGCPTGPLALYVGRFAGEKEVDLLLDGVARGGAPHRGPLVLVGDGPARRCAAGAGRERARHWLPFERDRDRLADLYAPRSISASRPARSRPSASRRSRPWPAARRCSRPTAGGVAENGEPLRRRARVRRRATPESLPRQPSALLESDLAGARRARAAATPRRITAGTRSSTGSSTIYRGVLGRVTLLVSIHDVTPALTAASTRLWTLCADAASCRRCWWCPTGTASGRSSAIPRSSTWLRERAADGAEIVLHGERHDEVGLPAAARRPVAAWGRTAREGEFLTLDGAAARERIGAAWRACGPRTGAGGFVPPAWLARQRGTHGGARGGARLQRGRSLHPAATRRPPSAVAGGALERAHAGPRAGARSPWPVVAWTLQRRAQLSAHRLPSAGSRPSRHGRSLGPTLDRWLARHAPAVCRRSSAVTHDPASRPSALSRARRDWTCWRAPGESSGSCGGSATG